LWKSAKASEPEDAKWSSDFGSGRPGWHIECSAMCGQTLGETIDIHGGGADLQFPHHENEIAQSESVNEKPLARFWVHNGFVRVDNEKMSKSLGNFFTIREVLARYDAETVRFFLVRTHYRSALNYSDQHLDDAATAIRRLYTTLQAVPPAPVDALDWSQPYAARFKSAMDEDFGTPDAVAVLFDLASEVNRTQSASLSGQLKALGACLGLLQLQADTFLKRGAGSAVALADDAVIDALIARRAQAKQDRDFAEADSIRAQLSEMGVVLKDGPTGTRWERAR